MDKVICPDAKMSIEDELKLAKKMLRRAVRAMCLTRDYVGEDMLPARPGWEWYDTCSAIVGNFDIGDWGEDFRIRVNLYKSRLLSDKFKNGDWVFGIGKDIGCSCVFTGKFCELQPFSYLDNFDPEQFRLATPEEIEEASKRGIDEKIYF